MGNLTGTETFDAMRSGRAHPDLQLFRPSESDFLARVSAGTQDADWTVTSVVVTFQRGTSMLIVEAFVVSVEDRKAIWENCCSDALFEAGRRRMGYPPPGPVDADLFQPAYAPASQLEVVVDGRNRAGEWFSAQQGLYCLRFAVDKSEIVIAGVDQDPREVDWVATGPEAYG